MAKKPPLSINADIPKKSAGKLTESVARGLDAFVDMFRPFSEARGLKADNIRLQREEVAIEIAKRAKAKLAMEKAPIKPIPPKILVPLIESSSIEDIEDQTMIEMWAELLASASKNAISPRFISILKEMNGEQAELLKTIAVSYWMRWEQPVNKLDGTVFDFNTSVLKKTIRPVFEQAYIAGWNGATILSQVTELLCAPGCALIDVHVSESGESEDDTLHIFTYRSVVDANKHGVNLSVLVSLGLLTYVHETFEDERGRPITIVLYYITSLGVALLELCWPELFRKDYKPDHPAAFASLPFEYSVVSDSDGGGRGA